MNFNEALRYYLKIKLNFTGFKLFDRPNTTISKYWFFISLWIFGFAAGSSYYLSQIISPLLNASDLMFQIISLIIYLIVFTISRNHIQKPFYQKVTSIIEKKVPGITKLDFIKLNAFVKNYEKTHPEIKLDNAIIEAFFYKEKK